MLKNENGGKTELKCVALNIRKNRKGYGTNINPLIYIPG
jgi:hypothetical protein